MAVDYQKECPEIVKSNNIGRTIEGDPLMS